MVARSSVPYLLLLAALTLVVLACFPNSRWVPEQYHVGGIFTFQGAHDHISFFA